MYTNVEHFMRLAREGLTYPNLCTPCGTLIKTVLHLNQHLSRTLNALADPNDTEALQCHNFWRYLAEQHECRSNVNIRTISTSNDEGGDIEAVAQAEESSESGQFSWTSSAAALERFPGIETIRRIVRTIRPYITFQPVQVPKLYIASLTSASFDLLRVKIAAQFSNYAFEIVEWRLEDAEHEPDVELPLLKLKDGKQINGWICILLTISCPRIMGFTTIDRAKVVNWIVFAEKLKRKSPQRDLNYINEYLLKTNKPYLIGESITLADIVVSLTIYDKIEPRERSRHKNLQKWLQDIFNTSTVQKEIGKVLIE